MPVSPLKSLILLLALLAVMMACGLGRGFNPAALIGLAVLYTVFAIPIWAVGVLARKIPPQASESRPETVAGGKRVQKRLLRIAVGGYALTTTAMLCVYALGTHRFGVFAMAGGGLILSRILIAIAGILAMHLCFDLLTKSLWRAYFSIMVFAGFLTDEEADLFDPAKDWPEEWLEPVPVGDVDV